MQSYSENIVVIRICGKVFGGCSDVTRNAWHPYYSTRTMDKGTRWRTSGLFSSVLVGVSLMCPNFLFQFWRCSCDLWQPGDAQSPSEILSKSKKENLGDGTTRRGIYEWRRPKGESDVWVVIITRLVEWFWSKCYGKAPHPQESIGVPKTGSGCGWRHRGAYQRWTPIGTLGGGWSPVSRVAWSELGVRP